MRSEAVEILASLGTALASGFLVGAEREHRQGRSMFGGARTYPLIALTGAVANLLGDWPLVAFLGVVGGLIAIAYLRDTDRDAEHLGMSSEVAAVLTLALGALCTARSLPLALGERLTVVAACATAVLALLSVKKPLHGVIARISRDDIYATTKLLVLAVIVLPLLPQEDLGPWGALNPRSIGLLVVLISAMSFAGYVAIRALGPRRGLGLTGFLGGLASSTAVTLSYAGRARQEPSLTHAYAVAIVLASATMFPRMLVEIYVVSAPLGQLALQPALASALGAALCGAWLYGRAAGRGTRPPDASSESEAPDVSDDIAVKNPFSISQALRFAAIFTVVLLVARAAQHYYQNAGTYLAAFLSGLADVDAITLSLARLHARSELASSTALSAIGLAAATNTASKAALAGILGGRRLGLLVGASLAVSIVTGLLGFLLLDLAPH